MNQQAKEAILKILAITEAGWNAEKHDAQLKSKLDAVKKIAKEANLAYDQQIQPHLVGVHPDNRDGMGVSGEKVHKLGANIADAGWSPEECFGATCFEDLPDHRGATFTVGLQRKSSKLPKQVFEHIRWLAASGTHTNQLFLAIAQAVPTDEPLIAEQGLMSKAKILARCPKMEEKLEKGLDWFVFGWQLWDQVPRLPWLVQAGANKPAACDRKPSMFQSLSGMQGDVSEALMRGEAIDKIAIMRHASKGSDYVPHFEQMLAWLMGYGGGSSSCYTQELCTFCKECCGTNPFVHGSIFGAIAKWPAKSTMRPATASVALLKMVAKRTAFRFSATDAKKIGDLEDMPCIERLLKAGRECCSEQPGGPYIYI